MTVEVGQDSDHLDVEVGIVGAERFDPQLMVLAVTVGLGSLVAKARCRVPDLPGGGRPMLDEGSHHRGGAFGPQGKVTTPLVDEVVHLLAHHIGARTDAMEDADLLEHRCLDQPVAGAPGDSGEGGDERLPSSRFGREHIVGALGGSERTRRRGADPYHFTIVVRGRHGRQVSGRRPRGPNRFGGWRQANPERISAPPTLREPPSVPFDLESGDRACDESAW
jgi:hypothetical protein